MDRSGGGGWVAAACPPGLWDQRAWDEEKRAGQACGQAWPALEGARSIFSVGNSIQQALPSGTGLGRGAALDVKFHRLKMEEKWQIN